MKLLVILILLLGPVEFASAAVTAKFDRKAHITAKGFSLDGKAMSDLKCGSYGGNKANEGTKAILTAGDLQFKLSCEGTETGSHFNLEVIKNAKPIGKIPVAAGSTGDCSDASETQMWIQDLNEDGKLDIYKLHKVEFIPGCESGEASKTVSAQVYYSIGSKELESEKLSDQEMLKLNKKFGFKI